MTDRAPIDWPAIRTEYETTTRPVIAIARDHGVSHTAVNQRAALECWTNPRRAQSQVSEPPVSDRAETSAETWGETSEPDEPAHDGLTAKQRAFVREYLIDLNATHAARRAGYSEAMAADAARQVLGSPRVKAAVDAALAARAARTEFTADRVLDELADMATANMVDFASWDGLTVTLKDSKLLTRAQTAAVIEVAQTKDGVRIKFDKLGALNSAGRHLGMFIDRTEIIPEIGGDQGADIPPRPETREEWMARRERELAAAAAATHGKGE